MSWLGLYSGCASGPAVKEASKAEKEGAAPLAYEDYCKAARKQPGDAAIVAGIKRTGPPAAAHWQSQAWQAMEQRRYGEAWRMLMRALEIRPDDPTVVKLLRQLQQQHPAEVAEARADWLRRGSGALALASLDEATPKRESPRTADKPTAVAKAEPTRTQVDPGPVAESEPPPGAKIPHRTPDVESSGGLSRPPKELKDNGPSQPGPAGEAAPGTQAKPVEPQAPAPAGESGMSESQKRHREWAEAFARVDAERAKQAESGTEEKPKPPETIPPAEAQPLKPAEVKRPPEPPPVKPVERRRSTEPPPPWPPPAPRPSRGDPNAAPMQPRPAEMAPAFLVLRTLSKKDKGFPKEALLVDGILIKLKGTGDEPQTDVELYDGKKRIKKIKGLRIGASETFPGHSGLEYRLVVLSIHHKTDTIRVGVQELPRIVTPAPIPKS